MEMEMEVDPRQAREEKNMFFSFVKKKTDNAIYVNWGNQILSNMSRRESKVESYDTCKHNRK